MRNNAKRLLSLLLAALLVFSLSLTGFAAEEKSLLSLSQSEDVVKGGKVTIQVDTAVDGVVADGKLTVSYSGTSLRFLEAQVGAAWSEDENVSLQVNAEKEDTVILAFAGVEAAKAGTVFTLTFEALEEEDGTVAVLPQDSYVTGAEDYTLDASTAVQVSCPLRGGPGRGP